MSVAADVTVILACYLIGCFAVGYYLVQFRTGQDMRLIGSGSTGARNVSRVLGKPGFVITLLGDVAKGVFALWLANMFNLPSWALGLTVVAVVAGHIWPVQMRFRGGKGLATALGISLMVDVLLTALLFAVAIAAFGVFRNLTPAGLLGLLASPIIAAALGHDGPVVMGMAVAVALILLAHRSNIAELLGLEEPTTTKHR